MAAHIPTVAVPYEACRIGGSLPSTANERGSASALRWPWHKRKDASNLRNRQDARPERRFRAQRPRCRTDTSGSATGPPKNASESWSSARTSTSVGTAVGPIETDLGLVRRSRTSPSVQCATALSPGRAGRFRARLGGRLRRPHPPPGHRGAFVATYTHGPHCYPRIPFPTDEGESK